MAFRPVSCAACALLFTTSSLWLAACSSSSSPDAGGTNDATTDAPAVGTGDGGDSHAQPRRDGAADAGADATARDAGDAHALIDGTSNRDAHALDGAQDATGDSTPQASSDAGLDARADAGIDTGTPALRYIGRTLTNNTAPDSNGTCTPTMPCFEWSGTQVVARFTGATEIDLMMDDDGNWFDVYVNGSLQGSPIVGVAGQASYVLATGLAAGTTYEVSLYKRTEASTAGRTQVSGVTFPHGGTLLSPSPPAEHRIEVIGDSISCGYGVLGASSTCTAAAANEDHADSYGALAAATLGAELYTIASSGRGVIVNIDGTTTGTVPEIYGDILPYVGSGFNVTAWDFASWVPDAVVIDLGTNDFLFANGDPGAAFGSTYLSFLQTVRHDYPDAYILCANGAILSGTEYDQAGAYINSAITAMNDSKISYLPFGTQDASNGEGCDGHPNVTTQQAMATQLVTALQGKL
jgi:hypothetical protein